MYQPLEMQIEDRAIAMPARAGETLFVKGEPCENILQIRSGVARAVSHSYEGDRQVMAFFFPGDLLGLPLAWEHRFSAEAVSDLLYTRHSPVSWHAELARTCREENRILEAVWCEEKAFMARGLILGRVGTLARMAAFLLSVVRRLSQRDGLIEFALPQTDIASYLATSPETVCRTLRQLRELRVIAMPRKDRLQILAPESLSVLSEKM